MRYGIVKSRMRRIDGIACCSAVDITKKRTVLWFVLAFKESLSPRFNLRSYWWEDPQFSLKTPLVGSVSKKPSGFVYFMILSKMIRLIFEVPPD